MSDPQKFDFAGMTMAELKELMAAAVIAEEKKATELAEQAKRAEEARVAAAVERARLVEEARKAAEARRSGVSEVAFPVVVCQRCEATSRTCTWALVWEAQAKSKSRGRAKAKACDQCVGLKASCKVDGDESQPVVPGKSQKRMRERVAEFGERTEEDAGRPSRRRRVYGEEESITEVDDQEWVKAANDMVLVQAEMNAKLGALMTAITRLAKQMELQQTEQKEERDRAWAEVQEILRVTRIVLEKGFPGRGRLLNKVLGKKAEVGMEAVEVLELTSSSSSGAERPEEEAESKVEKGPDGEESKSQPKLVPEDVHTYALASAWPGFFFGVATYLFVRIPYEFLLKKLLLWWFFPSNDGNNMEMLEMGRRASSDDFKHDTLLIKNSPNNFVKEYGDTRTIRSRWRSKMEFPPDGRLSRRRQSGGGIGAEEEKQGGNQRRSNWSKGVLTGHKPVEENMASPEFFRGSAAKRNFIGCRRSMAFPAVEPGRRCYSIPYRSTDRGGQVSGIPEWYQENPKGVECRGIPEVTCQSGVAEKSDIIGNRR
ncbi:uncharacterized protein EDB91DRAFT_1088915 [Suillus paluster]|uniref:uncharacterized protein n=1 Tax=Suillus paluster TaxID=48578 RepID=UPI001B860568|nr:uncharacterized protein EDB91DRAFT_1088915 [Suillus paluster]KAG1720199.1 hypothetical protein EDB91DRAFT_1088915 [Suillus paluster]